MRARNPQILQGLLIAWNILSVIVRGRYCHRDFVRRYFVPHLIALAESEDYAHAYRTLVDEVNALVDRNALAEEEAQQLSKFNAELLSHKNPAQKIVYVDRIRQELADTKQVS